MGCRAEQGSEEEQGKCTWQLPLVWRWPCMVLGGETGYLWNHLPAAISVSLVSFSGLLDSLVTCIEGEKIPCPDDPTPLKPNPFVTTFLCYSGLLVSFLLKHLQSDAFASSAFVGGMLFSCRNSGDHQTGCVWGVGCSPWASWPGTLLIRYQHDWAPSTLNPSFGLVTSGSLLTASKRRVFSSFCVLKRIHCTVSTSVLSLNPWLFMFRCHTNPEKSKSSSETIGFLLMPIFLCPISSFLSLTLCKSPSCSFL